jgi:DNA-binding transcriptional regulator YdaS (Cro superfamily)
VKEAEKRQALKALELAITKAGSQRAFGAICGVRQQTVWDYLHKQKYLPEQHVEAVEKAVGVSRHDLRPDLSRIFSA